MIILDARKICELFIVLCATSKRGLNPILAKHSFHILRNGAQVDLIDLLIAVNLCHC